MNRKTILNLTMAAAVLLASACSSEQDALQAITGTTVLNIDGGCNVYEITNSEQSAWQIVECPKWVSPVRKSGTATDAIKVYVESNSLTPLREGDIKVVYTNGVTRSVTTRQSDEQPEWSLQRSYAVGWSFDIRTYNDSRGLRDQVFNTQKIRDYEEEMMDDDDDLVYRVEPQTTTDLKYYFGEDASDLSKDMAGKLGVTGKFNVFSLDLQGSFGKTAMSNSKRIFSWIRGFYPTRKVYLNNIDMADAQEEGWFTADFEKMRNDVISSGGSDASIRSLIEHYGTHVVLSATLGGCYDYYYSTVLDESKDALKIEAAIKFGYGEKFKLNASGSYNNDYSSMNNETIEKFSVKGGDALKITNAIESGTVTQADTDNWLKDLNDNEKYELLSFNKAKISQLFPRSIAIKIESYMDRMYYSEIPITRSND